MALFTDGPPTTALELQKFENAILEAASTERIDIDAKIALAQEEITAELLLFLDRNSMYDCNLLVGQTIGIDGVVVTEPLKRWHAYKTLAMIYEDAYNNRLNDRYQGKSTRYSQLASSARQTLFDVGVGIVYCPIPRADPPVLTTVPMGVTGSSYFARVSWLDGSGQEGLTSAAVEATSADGSAVALTVQDAPPVIELWNVYAGDGPDTVTLQNATPLALGDTWMLPSTGLQSGPAPGDGQAPQQWIVDRKILPRG